MEFILFISFVVLLRILELIHSKRNEVWLLQQGAVEYGHRHYPYIVALHILFFMALILEYNTQEAFTANRFFLIAYFLLIALKIWVVGSLGKFWNTKIYHITGWPMQKKGLYKYVQHPNYIIVVAEIALIPLAFHLYYTACIFSLLNAILLGIRIHEENQVLRMDHFKNYTLNK